MSTVGGLRPEGESAPSNPYQVRIAKSFDDACAATGLTDAQIAELIEEATDVTIPNPEVSAWRRGDREFPAWVIPALTDAAGLEQRRGRWVVRRRSGVRGVTKASIPVVAVLIGMAVAGLVWGNLASRPPTPKGVASRTGIETPAWRSGVAWITPTPTAAAGAFDRNAPSGNAASPSSSSSTQGQAPPALSAGTVQDPTGSASHSTTRSGTSSPASAAATPASAATPAASPESTPAVSPTQAPATPAPTPAHPAPSPSPLRGIIGGLLGSLGL